MFTRLIEDEPETALAHAREAARLSPRLALTREAVGEAAYACGDYDLALRELKTAMRVSGSPAYLPVIADCERGLGRPERALDIAGSREVVKLSKEGRVELRIVAAGARRDLGEIDAALVTLKCPELQSESDEPWSLRLKYAYADILEELGRVDEAKVWFVKIAGADDEGLTDADERAAALG